MSGDGDHRQRRDKIGGGGSSLDGGTRGRAPGKSTAAEKLRRRSPLADDAEIADEAPKGGTDQNKRVSAAGDGGDAPADAGAPQAAAAPQVAGARKTPGSAGAAPAAAAPASGSLAVAKEERVSAQASVGGSAVSPATTPAHADDSDKDIKHQVAATGSPTFNGAAGANNCLPGDATGASVAWTLVETPATWGVSITSFTTTGTVNVSAWPSKPTEMVTPNTANPVDGGNITDAAGDNNWKFAVKEMEEYNQANGGRSSYWHSYEASKAHEWKHWNHDWMVDCIGALWPAANTDLDAITIPKASAADAAAATPLLQAKIDARMKTLDRALTAKWNAVPDSPGEAGANGYIAGQAVLDVLIAKVKAYAAKKGWT